MKKEVDFDIKALNRVVDVVRKYGGDKTKLSELQIKELEKVIVERGVLDNKEFALELARNRSVSLSDYMSVEGLLQRFPKFKEVEILETTYEVIYTVNGTLNCDEIKCDYISVEGDFVSAFKDNERVAIYNKDNFVRATLL